MTRQQHTRALLNERNTELIARLPSAISETEFELHYQPLVSAQHNTVQGVECLIRWPQSDGSAIAPSEFIKLAEQSHVIVDITHWVIETSLKQLGQWHSMGHTLALQINISARDLDEPELVTYITQHLRKNNIEAHFLTLEITENLVLGNPTECITILQKLRDLGVGISLDDFGTGYSSMTLLNQLPLSQIKIDRSFVLGMEHNSKHMSIVQSTLDLGKNIGLEIIAEGVENAQQALLLKQMNCTLIQGYYIAKPMSAEKLEHWLMCRYANSAPQRKHTN
jgi:EAL domain-containing protein (putative c-di-GMP-specific phosphodiesterase class I)